MKPWFGVALFLVILWGVTFWPVLAGHKNLMGYSRLDARLTGAPLDLAPQGGIRWPARGDTSLHMIFLPGKAFLASEIARGVYPLWNPRIACGQPVASDPQYQPFSPFFWPYLARPSAWTFSLGIVCMALFGMIGFSLYLREMGWAFPAVALGGALLAWNSLTSQTFVLSNPWAMWACAWAIWGAERWVRGRRLGMPICLAGAALAICAGHPVSGALYIGILAAYAALFSGRWPVRRRVVFGLAGIAGLIALTAAVTFPFLANLPCYSSYKSGWDGGPYNPWWFLSDPASTVYIPMPVCALAVAGAVAGGDRRRWFFLALGVYGFLVMVPWFTSGVLRWAFSLGGNLVALYGQEALWLGVAWLAVRGVQVLASGAGGGRRLALRCLLYGAGGYYVLAWLSSEFTFQAFSPLRHPALSLLELTAFAGVVASVIFHRAPMQKVALCVSAVIVATLVCFSPNRPSALFTSADLSRDPPEVVRAILAEGGGEGRWRMTGEYLDRADGLADLTPNQPEEWGLWDIRTTNPIILADFAAFSQAWQSDLHFVARWLPNQSDELLRFLGVRWVVQDSARPEEPGRGWRTPCLLAVREVDRAVPWVRAVGRWETADSPERQMSSTYRLIRSGAWRTTAVLDRPATAVPREDTGWTDPAIRWEEKGPNRWRWLVSGPSASLFVVLQNAHPNWSASLDGRRIPILRAYGTFQAVEVPAGQHEVVMRYDEPWFWRGAAVSTAAWIALLAWAGVCAWRREGGSPGR